MNTQTLLDNVNTINSNEAIIVNAKEFLKELRQVVSATAKPSDHRPNLTYVHVKIGKTAIVLEATDAHTLERSNVQAEISSELTDKEFLIDGKFAKNLSKAPTKHGEKLIITPQFSQGKYQGITTFDDGSEKYIDDSRGNISVFGYPDLEKVTPYDTDATCQFSVEKKELYPILSEMKKVLADLRKDRNWITDVINLKVTDDGRVVIKYDWKENDVTFEPKVTDVKILRAKKKEYEVNFNIKLLMKQLRNCGNREKLTFRLNGICRPFTFTRENSGLGLVCPVRQY